MPPATTAPSPASLPLDGVLVADFSRVLAGPLATMTLADLGARVIKVEHPERGDDTRGWAPPRSATGATYFESVNRNKESVGWDLKDPEDQRRAAALAARADVVVHNLKPGTMERLGLGYDDVARENPSVVYAAVSGFGDREGRDLPGAEALRSQLPHARTVASVAEAIREAGEVPDWVPLVVQTDDDVRRAVPNDCVWPVRGRFASGSAGGHELELRLQVIDGEIGALTVTLPADAEADSDAWDAFQEIESFPGVEDLAFHVDGDRRA